MNTTYAENFMRSANAPAISAGVITANMHWYIMKRMCGTVDACPCGSMPTPRRKA